MKLKKIYDSLTFERIKRLFLLFLITKVIGIPVFVLMLGALCFSVGSAINSLLVYAGEDEEGGGPGWRVLLACTILSIVAHETLVYVSYAHFASSELSAELLMENEDLNRSYEELDEVLKNKRKAIIDGYNEPYRLWCKIEMTVNDVNRFTEIRELKVKRKNEIL